MTEWDAARYHRISDPQFDWGQRVIARLQPATGERILDLGCGTGRLTQEIGRAVGRGLVVGLDESAAMLAVARAGAPGGGDWLVYVRGTAVALPFSEAFDAVFSNATLHWIRDHDAVFSSVFRALVRGGRFAAQCGGKGNLARLLEHAGRIMGSAGYELYFRDWSDGWNFADASTTAGRLRNAGFVAVETWLEEAPVQIGNVPGFAEFVACVCLRTHLERLPLSLREPFTTEVTEAAAHDTPPLTLDYRRLNIDARRP